MNFRSLTTIYLGSGAACIAYALVRPDFERGTPWLLALLALFGIALALAAYLTWRRHPAAWALGVGLQLAQLPHIRTELFSWVLYSPVSLVVGWHDSIRTLLVQLETGAVSRVGILALPDGWTIGVNVVPLVALWLVNRAHVARSRAAHIFR